MTVALVAVVAVPNTASAIPIHVHKTVDVVGGVEVQKEIGVIHVAPRDSDEDGYANKDDDCPKEPYSMNGGCEPEPVTSLVSSYSAPTPAETSVPTTTDSSGYAIPSYIVECESGGDYTAQNPSGAYGAYQIMPGTADAYGCDLSTPAGQDECAGRIYAAEGSSPWVCG